MHMVAARLGFEKAVHHGREAWEKNVGRLCRAGQD